MKIAVLDDYQDLFRKLPCFALLKDHEVVIFQDTEKDPVKLVKRIKDFDALILNSQRSAFPRAVVEKLPKLRLIAQTAGIKDHLDVAACTDKGIAVAAVPSGVSYSTVELTWGLILASVRHIPYEVQQMKQGVWQTTMGTVLHGKTLGIFGFARIGSCVAKVGNAFGMKVICWGQEGSKARAREAGYEVPASREAFFESADVICLHVRYKAETHGIITAADLARMKPTALFVNTSRARLIQEGALVEALKQGQPGFAAVDVYEDEPVLGGNHPLLKMSNVTCTPHLGGAVQSSYETRYRIAVEDVLGFVSSGRPVNLVNPEVLGRH